MVERGVTQRMAEQWVSTGRVLQQSSGNYLYISREGAVVLDRAGRIITAYPSSLYDDAMRAIVNQLFM
jgi:hypothetical protein